MDAPLRKVTFKRHYCDRKFCKSQDFDTSRTFSCSRCPISHERLHKCPLHRSCVTKPSNLSSCSAGSKSRLNDSFNFNQLPPLLQDRFVKLANSYEMFKLQQVNKDLNNKIPANTCFEVYEKMVVTRIADRENLQLHFQVPNLQNQGLNLHSQNEQFGWGKYRNGIYLNPLVPTHIDLAKDALINYELFGIGIPDGWIRQAIKQNVMFYLESVRIERCNLSGLEIQAICQYGAIRYLYLEQITASSPISMNLLSPFLKTATRLFIDVKNFEYESDWANQLLDNPAMVKFNRVTLKGLPFNFDVAGFDRFVKERIIKDKTELDYRNELYLYGTTCVKQFRIDCVLKLSFDEDGITRKKTFWRMVDTLFDKFYKRVSRTEFDGYHFNKKFMVERSEHVKPKHQPYPERNERIDRCFYVACGAVPITPKEIESIKQQLDNLEI